MSVLSDYNKLKKNQANKQLTKKTSTSNSVLDDYNKLKAESEAKQKAKASALSNDDIAPVLTTKANKKEKWYDGFLQAGDALSDGFQLSDIPKTIIGTNADIITNLPAGVVGWGENVIDAGATKLGQIAERRGNTELAEKMRGFVTKDLYDEKEVVRNILTSKVAGVVAAQNPLVRALKGIYTLDDWLNSKEVDNGFGGTVKVREDNSILGDQSDSLLQSAGETVTKMALQTATGGIPVGDIITGVTVYGAQAEEALKEDATFKQANGSALISAGAEIIFEKLSGGIKIGGVALDDGLTRIVSKNISNVALKNAVHFGLDVAGEAGEELLTEFVSK